MWSHSRVECFEKCPFKYKLHYLDEIETIPQTEYDNALILGTALHTGIEKDTETAINQYFMSYPIIDDNHINESIKLDHLIERAKEVLPSGEYEVEINDTLFTGFHGYIDLLAPVDDTENLYDIYDFKYSNNIDRYMNSRQLHLYKYFFELCNPGKKIRNLFFCFIPKPNIKQKKTETLYEFRDRLTSELEDTEVKIIRVDFDYSKVIDFLHQTIAITNETEFTPQLRSYLCRYCEFTDYCQKGWTYFMTLPCIKRRNIEKVDKRTLWIYGAAFSGKTTFANEFPDPLMLNTDGNIKFVDAPYIRIKDEIKVDGRMTKRTAAWQVFKEVIDELEKKDNDFKTIVVDLLEDLYEYCRLYTYDKMNIKHESDDSFKAWDMVRGEFLNTLKRLMALDYENIILISHEDTSKDITKRGGDKITAIKPNLQEKVAVKVAGMVDIVARIISEDNNRIFSFKTSEVIFGGGRLTVSKKEIPLDVNALFEIYDEANRNAIEAITPVKVEPAINEPIAVGVPETSDIPEKEEQISVNVDMIEINNENVSVNVDTGETIENSNTPASVNTVPAEPVAQETENKPRTRKSRKVSE